MPITTRCPECGHKYRFDEKHAGRQAKCKNGHVFTVTPQTQPVAGSEPAPLKAAAVQVAEQPAEAVRLPNQALSTQPAIATPVSQPRKSKKALIAVTAVACILIGVLAFSLHGYLSPKPATVASASQDTATQNDAHLSAGPVNTPKASKGISHDEVAARVINATLEVTSDKYTEAGFKELTFGMDRTEVERHTGPLSKYDRRLPFLVAKSPQGGQIMCVFWDNRLRIVGRNNCPGSMDDLISVFGKTSSEMITTSPDKMGGLSVNAKYVFPKAVVTASYNRGRLGFSLLDRSWLAELGHADVKSKSQALLYLRRMLDSLAQDGVSTTRVHEFPGTQMVAFTEDGRLHWYYYEQQQYERLAAKPSQLKEVRGTNPLLTVHLMPEKGGRITARDGIEVSIQFGNLPNSVIPEPFFKLLSPFVMDWTSTLAQAYFPPEGDTIKVIKDERLGTKTYQWRTTDFWQVSILPDNAVRVQRRTPNL